MKTINEAIEELNQKACVCVPCSFCQGNGTYPVDFRGNPIPSRMDDLDGLENCEECRNGVAEICERCIELEELLQQQQQEQEENRGAAHAGGGTN